MAITSINPATGETLKEFSAVDDAEIEHRLQRAEQAFGQHRRNPLPMRAELMMAVASLLDR
jgi:succinate-semialdehyde dehydrogenase/glutarate-semialdehyde dehydrogenase